MVDFKDRRRYYRHPIEFPIQVRETRGSALCQRNAADISRGGLSFYFERELLAGVFLCLSIPVRNQLFRIEAKVTYCVKDRRTGLFKTGVAFNNSESTYQAKLAEEILRIEQYRATLSQKTGKVVSEEEAARAWIKKNAQRFADLFSSPEE